MIPTVHGWGSLLSLATSPLLRECSAVSVIEIAEPNSFVLAEDSRAEFFRGGSSALSSRKNLGYAYVTDNRLCFFSFILVSFYCIMADFGSSSSGRSKRSPSARSGVIQPGAMVSAFYGPLDDSDTSGSEKRRSRTKIRGAVLGSHSENNWLVHWFLVGKNAYAPFNKLKIEDAADPIAKKYVEKLLAENSKTCIGGPVELRTYVDDYFKGGSVSTNKRKSSVQLKRAKDSVARRLPMSMEKGPAVGAKDKQQGQTQLSSADSQPGEYFWISQCRILCTHMRYDSSSFPTHLQFRSSRQPRTPSRRVVSSSISKAITILSQPGMLSSMLARLSPLIIRTLILKGRGASLMMPIPCLKTFHLMRKSIMTCIVHPASTMTSRSSTGTSRSVLNFRILLYSRGEAKETRKNKMLLAGPFAMTKTTILYRTMCQTMK